MSISELLAIVAIVFSGIAAARALLSPPRYQTGDENVVKSLSARITELELQLKAEQERAHKLELRIVELEAKLAIHAPNTTTTEPTPAELMKFTPPLLAIFGLGLEEEITRRDLNALERAGVDFTRLANARKIDIVDEMRRRRKDDNLPCAVHISSHGGDMEVDGTPRNAVKLNDGPADMQFWHDVLPGIQVVLLASCKNAGVADELAGIVEYVVYFREGVGNRDAEDFTEAFWGSYFAGNIPEIAYNDARKEVPQVRDFVDMRAPRRKKRT